MAVPIFLENSFERYVNFPDQFYDINTGNLMQNKNIINHYNDLVLVFIRAGHVIIAQNIKNNTQTSDISNKFIVKAALDYSNNAK